MTLTQAALEKIRSVAAVNKRWMWTDDVVAILDEIDRVGKERDALNQDLRDKDAELAATQRNLQGAIDSMAGQAQILLTQQGQLQDARASLARASAAIAESHREGCYTKTPKEIRLCHQCRAVNVETARCEAGQYRGWSLCRTCWDLVDQSCVACRIAKALG